MHSVRTSTRRNAVGTNASGDRIRARCRCERVAPSRQGYVERIKSLVSKINIDSCCITNNVNRFNTHQVSIGHRRVIFAQDQQVTIGAANNSIIIVGTTDRVCPQTRSNVVCACATSDIVITCARINPVRTSTGIDNIGPITGRNGIVPRSRGHSIGTVTTASIDRVISVGRHDGVAEVRSEDRVITGASLNRYPNPVTLDGDNRARIGRHTILIDNADRANSRLLGIFREHQVNIGGRVRLEHDFLYTTDIVKNDFIIAQVRCIRDIGHRQNSGQTSGTIDDKCTRLEGRPCGRRVCGRNRRNIECVGFSTGHHHVARGIRCCRDCDVNALDLYIGIHRGVDCGKLCPCNVPSARYCGQRRTQNIVRERNGRRNRSIHCLAEADDKGNGC